LHKLNIPLYCISKSLIFVLISLFIWWMFPPLLTTVQCVLQRGFLEHSCPLEQNGDAASCGSKTQELHYANTLCCG